MMEEMLKTAQTLLAQLRDNIASVAKKSEEQLKISKKQEENGLALADRGDELDEREAAVKHIENADNSLAQARVQHEANNDGRAILEGDEDNFQTALEEFSEKKNALRREEELLVKGNDLLRKGNDQLKKDRETYKDEVLKKLKTASV